MKALKKIFLAEDDEDDRIFFQNFLQNRADIAEMRFADNGIELLDSLRTSPDNELPDFIILDQNMPKMNGTQTLNLLKSDNRYAGIPVMVYSTYANSKLEEDCARKGALYVSNKPSDKEGYNKMIDEFFRLLS